MSRLSSNRSTIKRLSYYDKRRRWWEFIELYRQLSQSSIHSTHYYNHQSSCSKYSLLSRSIPTNKSSERQLSVSNYSSYNQTTPSQTSKHLNTQKPPLNNSRITSNKLSGPVSRQNQVKRQREWVYLSHYLAIEGLDPIHIISGNDDGREPDFTLIFSKDGELIYVGVELTTLPRLRDRMGEVDLIAKRWYWQGLQAAARQRVKQQEEITCYKNGCFPNFERFKLPVKTIYMPNNQFLKCREKMSLSQITQSDVDEVMAKKAHKVEGYHARRPLDALWLLVHTDKYQPESILTEPTSGVYLTHGSGFDQIHITRYPSHKVINVTKRSKAN